MQLCKLIYGCIRNTIIQHSVQKGVGNFTFQPLPQVQTESGANPALAACRTSGQGPGVGETTSYQVGETLISQTGQGSRIPTHVMTCNALAGLDHQQGSAGAMLASRRLRGASNARLPQPCPALDYPVQNGGHHCRANRMYLATTGWTILSRADQPPRAPTRMFVSAIGKSDVSIEQRGLSSA